MKLRVVVVMYLLCAVTAAAAQEVINSPDYHARHNAGSVYYQGPGQQSAPPPPRPTGWWETTWGAIAPSPVGGVLGTAVGASTKEEAEQRALQDCIAKGGGACAVDLAYHNQCAVMILGDKFISTYSNATIEEASERGLARCRSRDTNCSVYYSACTEPIFHKY